MGKQMTNNQIKEIQDQLQSTTDEQLPKAIDTQQEMLNEVITHQEQISRNPCCYIIPYQKFKDIDKQFVNDILLAHIFIPLTDKFQEIRDYKNHQIIKIFNYGVISDENKQLSINKLKTYYQHALKRLYNVEQTDYYNYYKLISYQLESGFKWINLPLNQKIYAYFTQSNSIGCQHYCRGCQLQCSICNKFYTCRFCHNDVEEHEFVRQDVKIVKCIRCGLVQQFSNKCIQCNMIFGLYSCDKCKLVDSTGVESKPIYHCNQCGYCLTGLQQFSKHCFKCNNCFNRYFFDQHECCQTVPECCVCFGDLVHTTQGRVVVPVCHHQLHATCYRNLIQQGIFKCPICKRTLMNSLDRNEIIRQQREIVQCTVVPRIFVDRYVVVQCNDCQQKWFKQFSINYYYCPTCHTFNCDICKEQTELQDITLKEQYQKQTEQLIQNNEITYNDLPNQPTNDGIRSAIKNLITKQVNNQYQIDKEEQDLINNTIVKLQTEYDNNMLQFLQDQIIHFLNSTPGNFNGFIQQLKEMDKINSIFQNDQNNQQLEEINYDYEEFQENE